MTLDQSRYLLIWLSVTLLTTACLCLLRYFIAGVYRFIREIREDRAADELGRRAVAAELERAAHIARHRTDPMPAVRARDLDTGNVKVLR